MASKKKRLEKLRRWAFSGRTLRWGLVVLCIVALAWLGAWLAQRSLRTPARMRAMRTWLDENLNADVSSLGDMVVRINLVRDSRVVLHNVEIEHPNPVFPGKFARIGRMGIWAPPWSAAGLFAGSIDFLLNDIRVEIEQAPSGEWSHDGLMQPLAVGDSKLPFPMPKIKEWEMEVRRGKLDLRRRGYELGLSMDARVTGRAGRSRIAFRADSVPFSFGLVDSEERKQGVAGPVNLGLRLGEERGTLPAPIPGACQATVRNLPVATLPFLVTGIPMEDSAGVFNGLIRYDRHDEAAGSLHIEGELNDASLSVFGLPRTAPLRLNWPFGPREGANLQANIHMGPSGFGAFTMNVPLNDKGAPTALSMRGDVAALDAIPGFFLKYSQWPDWLSRTFPLIEWRAGRWLGFGWEGENLAISLSRGTAGMNLTGEAEMMGGRVRLSMSPGQADTPITIAAEKLDAARLSERLSRLLPVPFQAKAGGSTVNLTWRGFPDETGAIPEWGTGMVWSKPIVDIAGSGSWWQSMARVPEAIALALPEWGGGDGAELMAISLLKEMELDQVSIVAEKAADGSAAVEFRAFGDYFGQATGLLERHRDGTVEGEILLAGASAILAATQKANPELATVLDLLANDSPGLRVAFRHDAEHGGEFIFPFLQDALRIREMLGKEEGARQ